MSNAGDMKEGEGFKQLGVGILDLDEAGDLQGGGGGHEDARSTVPLSFAPLRLMLSTEPTLGSTEH